MEKDARWYALTQLGKVIKDAKSQELARSDDAFYYIKVSVYSESLDAFRSILHHYKYEIFNFIFEPTTLKYNGIKGTQEFFKEVQDKNFKHDKRSDFYLIDRGNNEIKKSFGGYLSAIQDCISFMNELGNYGSYKEMELVKKVHQLEASLKLSSNLNAELDAKNKLTEAKLQEIYASKTDLRKLVALLYEEEKETDAFTSPALISNN